MLSLPVTTAVSAYDRARSAIAPQTGAVPLDLMRAPQAISSGDRFMQALEAVDTAGAGVLTGATSAQTLVQTVAETELALETVTAIRDKVVEAYQEILRMPV